MSGLPDIRDSPEAFGPSLLAPWDFPRLTQTNAPLPGESLFGYLVNLAYRLDIAPRTLATLTGLEPDVPMRSIDISFAARLSTRQLATFARKTAMTRAEATALTFEGYDGVLFEHDSKAAVTLHGSQFFNVGLTRFCPRCLATPPITRIDAARYSTPGDPQTPRRTRRDRQHPGREDSLAKARNRVLWAKAWTTPWAVACTRHGCMLLDRCPDCGVLVGDTGTRYRSLVPAPYQQVRHPAACRVNLSPDAGTTITCDARLDQADTVPASPELLRYQARIDALIDARRPPGCPAGRRSTEEDVDPTAATTPSAGLDIHPDTNLGSNPDTDPDTETIRTAAAWSSIGLPVTPIEYVRDLRMTCLLIQMGATDALFDNLPDTIAEPTRLHVARQQGNHGKNPEGQRAWTQPPTDVNAMAGLLISASAILDGTIPLDTTEALAQRAISSSIVWRRARILGNPSPGLAAVLAGEHPGYTAPSKLHVTRRGQATDLHADNVPALIPKTMFDRHFPAMGRKHEYNVRRAISITIHRFLTDSDMNTAAELLGYHRAKAGNTACYRASQALQDHGIGNEDYRQRVSDILNELQVHPGLRPNYQQRRDHFTSGWSLTGTAWNEFTAALFESGLARRDTKWVVRHPAFNVWFWTHITQGDSGEAPMLPGPSERPPATRLAVKGDLNYLIKVMRPALVDVVAHHADQYVRSHQLDTPSAGPVPARPVLNTDPQPGKAIDVQP